MYTGDRLPTPLTLVMSLGENEQEKPPAKRKNSNAKKNNNQNETNNNTKNKKNETVDPFFRVSDTHQPSLLSVIELKAGVTLKEGDGQKAGPQRQEDMKHMSRQQFTSHQTTLSISLSSTLPSEVPETDSPREMKIKNSKKDNIITADTFICSDRIEGDKKDRNKKLMDDPNWGVNTSNNSFVPYFIPSNKWDESIKKQRTRALQSPVRKRIHSIRINTSNNHDESFLPPLSSVLTSPFPPSGGKNNYFKKLTSPGKVIVNKDIRF